MKYDGQEKRFAITSRALRIGLFLALASAAVLGYGVLGGTPREFQRAAAMAGPGSPEAARGLSGYPFAPLVGPFRIGIQPGHWMIADLPDELARLRTSTGAVFGSLKEVDLNLAVSRLVVKDLVSAGYDAALIPAAVPAGYRADLFVSIHADRADRRDRAGWKLAPPWRPSRRSRELADALAAAFRAADLVEDIGGVTANMRGYFGFSWWRFDATISPYTPAALVEMGFMGNDADRARMRDTPALYAAVIVNGIESYLSDYARDDLEALVPTVYQGRLAGVSGTSARAAPSFDSEVLERYDPGRYLRPVDSADGTWLEVYSRSLRRGVWVHTQELD